MFVQPAYNNSVQLGFAPSIYSPGQYSMAPQQQYINPYYQQAQQQVAQQQSSGPNLLSIAQQGKSIISPSNGSGFINNIGGSLGFATTAPAATYTGAAGSLPWQVAGSLAPSSATGAGAALPWAAGGVEGAGTLSQGSGLFGSGAGGASTLGGVMGAAGLGAFAGSFLGKIGGNSTGGSIGGGIGAGIGMAVGGPIGAVIGGAIGGIGGGFFGGNKPATSSDEYRAMLNADGTYTGTYHGGKNAKAYAGFGEAGTKNLSSMLQKASKELGIQFNNKLEIGGGISTLHGGSHLNVGIPRNSDSEEFQGKNIFYDYQNKDESNNAMKEALVTAATLSGYTDIDKLNKWYDTKTSGTTSGSFIVPIKDKAKFDDFMGKFKAQDTVNGTNGTTTTT